MKGLVSAISFTVAAAATAALMPAANAQKLTVYGVQGFVADPVKQPDRTYKLPDWVQPNYGSIGALAIGTYDVGAGTIDLYGAHNTSLGVFDTPVPAPPGPGASAINFNGVEVGNFGSWFEPYITSAQSNYGLYFAGTPATYTRTWQVAVQGTYNGKAVGLCRLGYKLVNCTGTVQIKVSYSEITIEFTLPSDEAGKFVSFVGRGSSGSSQGLSFNSFQASGQDYLFNSHLQAGLSHFTSVVAGRLSISAKMAKRHPGFLRRRT